MGLSSKDFYTLTPAEFYFKMKGHDVIKWERWEQSRLIAFNVYCSIPLKKGSVHKSIEKFFPLPSDKSNKVLRKDSDMSNVWKKLKERNNVTNS